MIIRSRPSQEFSPLVTLQDRLDFYAELLQAGHTDEDARRFACLGPKAIYSLPKEVRVKSRKPTFNDILTGQRGKMSMDDGMYYAPYKPALTVKDIKDTFGGEQSIELPGDVVIYKVNRLPIIAHFDRNLWPEVVSKKALVALAGCDGVNLCEEILLPEAQKPYEQMTEAELEADWVSFMQEIGR